MLKRPGTLSSVQSIIKNSCIFLNTRYFQTKGKSKAERRRELVEQTLTVKGQTLFVPKFGHGPHNVFILPGALGIALWQLDNQILCFDQSKYTVYSWDQPGYGKSAPPIRKIGPNGVFDDVPVFKDLLNELGHKKYSLLGWCGGAVTAVMTYLDEPDRFNSLVLWGAYSTMTKEDAKSFLYYADFNRWGVSRKTKEPSKLDIMKNILVTQPYFERFGEKFARDQWNTWMHRYAELSDRPGGEIYSKQLHRIKCPTLIIHGDRDALVSVKNAEYLHKNIKGSKLCILRDAPHNCNMLRPQDFNELIVNFLDTVKI